MTPDELAAIRERDAQFHTSDPDNARTGFDRRALLAEVERLTAELDAERARVERVRALAGKWMDHRENWYYAVPVLDALNDFERTGTEQQGADQ